MALRVKPEPPLSELLKIAREQGDWSQKELAEHLGVSARTIQNWESGVTPRPSHRRAIRSFIQFVDCEEAA